VWGDRSALVLASKKKKACSERSQRESIQNLKTSSQVRQACFSDEEAAVKS
jgi:hypothetical protein